MKCARRGAQGRRLSRRSLDPVVAAPPQRRPLLGLRPGLQLEAHLHCPDVVPVARPRFPGLVAADHALADLRASGLHASGALVEEVRL